MALESLRRYIKDQAGLEEYTGSLASFDNNQLIRAEQDIDKVIKIYYEGANRPFLLGRPSVYSAVLTDTQATVTNLSPINDGYFDFTVLEILEGANRGKQIAIESNIDNVLSFFDTQAGLDETSQVKLFQIAKFPRSLKSGDTSLSSTGDTYLKTIPGFIKECVALQYLYRVAEGDDLLVENLRSGYEVSKDSYSEDYDTKVKKTALDRVSPEALDILYSYGLIGQTL
jgi:hypothetical protein